MGLNVCQYSFTKSETVRALRLRAAEKCKAPSNGIIVSATEHPVRVPIALGPEPSTAILMGCVTIDGAVAPFTGVRVSTTASAKRAQRQSHYANAAEECRLATLLAADLLD